MIAEALRREEADQQIEGFSVVASSSTTSPLSKFSRQKYETLRAQGVAIADIEEMERKEFAAAQASSQVPQNANQNKASQHSNQSGWDNRGDNQRQAQQGRRQDSNPTAFQATKQPHERGQASKNHPPKQKNPGTVFRQETDNSANREHDKQSQGKYSRKPIAKKGGEGKANWGNEIKDQTYTDYHGSNQKSTGGESWDSTPSSPVLGNKTKDSQPKTNQTQATATTKESSKPEDKKDAPTTTDANTTKAPLTPDPDDEGFGKKTLAEYAKEKEAEQAALQKLLKEKLGQTTGPRTETEKNFDLSKCIENDKQDKKLQKTAVPKGKQPKPSQPESKSKIVHINDFIGEDAVIVQAPKRSTKKSQTYAPPTEKNFPLLGDQPKKQYPRNQNPGQNQGQNQQGSRQNQGQQQTSGQNQQGSRQNQGQQGAAQNQQQGTAQNQQQGSRQNQGQQGAGQNQQQGSRQNQGQQGTGQNQQQGSRQNQGQQQTSGQGQKQGSEQNKTQ
jgi:hypothetical protein